MSSKISVSGCFSSYDNTVLGRIRITYTNVKPLSPSSQAMHRPAPIIDFRMPRKKRQRSGFGERLRTLRKARGLTQVQLASAANTTQRAISYYENEPGYPPVPAVIALADALGVSTDELLGAKASQRERNIMSPETRRLWRKFQQFETLPEKDQRAVIRLINSLASSGEPKRMAG
jgi:transcriptional regulator with XRE-family HTH domain